jgi:hypothetical protein
MTEQRFRITMLVVAAVFIVPMVVAIAYAILSQPPAVETLYTIPAPALIYEPPGYTYPSDDGPSINEGCTASDCCAH